MIPAGEAGQSLGLGLHQNLPGSIQHAQRHDTGVGRDPGDADPIIGIGGDDAGNLTTMTVFVLGRVVVLNKVISG